MKKFKKNLETKARELVKALPKDSWDRSLPGTLKREIALTVAQINQLKKQHKKQLRKLLRIECDIITDLKQMRQQLPWYTENPDPQKDKLNQRLFDIEKERRSLSLRLEEKTQVLDDKLLSLINKHEQLDL